MTRDPLEGVAANGEIVTGVAAERIPAAFRPVVDDCSARIGTEVFSGLHGLYLYGSVATGQAKAPTSDLDLLAVWEGREPPEMASVTAELSCRHRALVREVAVASATIADVWAPSRDGLGNRCFIRHYCIFLAGHDLRPALPACRPSRAIADALNDDLGALIEGWRRELQAATALGSVDAVARRVARKVLLVAATVESAEHGGWTTDRAAGVAAITRNHPEWAGVAAMALSWCDGRAGADSASVTDVLGLGVWLDQHR